MMSLRPSEGLHQAQQLTKGASSASRRRRVQCRLSASRASHSASRYFRAHRLIPLVWSQSLFIELHHKYKFLLNTTL